MPQTFLGIDLGWYGKPTGLAAIHLEGEALRLTAVTRLEKPGEIAAWISRQIGNGSAVAAVDAPLIIRNPTGIRPAEAALNRDFRRYHAGCHAANLGLPFASNVLAFARSLEALGFQHDPAMPARAPGRYQCEIHPHAATIRLFGLPQIVKYKRGLRADRARELRRLRTLLLRHLPALDPPFTPSLPSVPRTGPLKPAEDQIDAVLCAYIAAHWWHWSTARNHVYGDAETGWIVVPDPPETHSGFSEQLY